MGRRKTSSRQQQPRHSTPGQRRMTVPSSRRGNEAHEIRTKVADEGTRLTNPNQSSRRGNEAHESGSAGRDPASRSKSQIPHTVQAPSTKAWRFSGVHPVAQGGRVGDRSKKRRMKGHSTQIALCLVLLSSGCKREDGQGG